MLVDLGNTSNAKIVRSLSSCIWLMNKEIVDQSRIADRILTKSLIRMQECVHSISGYLGDDPDLIMAHKYIQGENVLGVFGDLQNGLIKAQWKTFCDLVADETGLEIEYGHNKPIIFDSDVNIVWYVQLGLKYQFLTQKLTWKKWFSKTYFAIND